MIRRLFRRLLSRRRPEPEPRIRSLVPFVPALYRAELEGTIRELTEEDLRPRPRPRLSYWEQRRHQRGYYLPRRRRW